MHALLIGDALTATQANFTSAERGMGSEWLGRHQASLFGTVKGNASVVALTLSSALLLCGRKTEYLYGWSAASRSRSLSRTCASSKASHVSANPTSACPLNADSVACKGSQSCIM